MKKYYLIFDPQNNLYLERWDNFNYGEPERISWNNDADKALCFTSKEFLKNRLKEDNLRRMVIILEVWM